MKEYRLNKLDFIYSCPPYWYVEDWVKMKLFDMGFDLNRPYEKEYDDIRDEYIFRQGEKIE